MKKHATTKRGFTIVELLTVMSVIAVLIGLLVPALNMVKDFSRQIQQSAQLHSIEVALDLYKVEFGAYPPSNENSLALPLVDPASYCGANKLAEALVGLDFLGFHPASEFRSDGLATIIDKKGVKQPNVRVYQPGAFEGDWQTAEENIRARGGKFGGPFIELENANAFLMQDVYDVVGTFDQFSVVLCDVYAKKRTALSGSKKAGMPILYFRARTQYVQQDSTVGTGIEDDIYYYRDNENLLTMETSDQAGVPHPLGDTITDWLDFEDMIVNPQVFEAAGIRRPYRAGSYILISAGKDGLYGTADDITNFDKTE